MNTTAITFDNISKEIKTKISKIGKDALIKRYNAGSFEDDQHQQIAALHYIEKRGQLKQVTWYPTPKGIFGRHRSQMTDQEIEAAELNRSQIKAENKAKRQAQEQQQKQTVQPVETSKASNSSKSIKKSIEQSKSDEQFDGICLTENEVLLLNNIWNGSKISSVDQLIITLEMSVRQVKAILASLKHKGITTEWDIQDLPVEFSDLGMQIVNGDVAIKAKKKYEKSSISIGRVTVNIDGKTMEKSAYVRKLLREFKHITTKEINEKLLEVGFNKIYHSELTRCKKQLGIVTTKREDV